MNPITPEFARTADQQHHERLTREYAAARRTSEAWKRAFRGLLSLPAQGRSSASQPVAPSECIRAA